MTVLTTDAAEREGAVQAAFDSHRRGRVGRLEQSDVTVIGTAAATHGVKFTVELVRRISGGGSPNTIHPMIDHFTRIDLPRLVNGRQTTVPAPLAALWTQLQDAARDEGEQALIAPREALEQGLAQLAKDRAALDAERHELAAERAAIDRVAGELRDAFDQLHARNTELEGALESARFALAGEAQQRAELQANLQEWHARATISEKRLSEATGAHEAALASLNERVSAAIAEADGLRHDLQAAQRTIDVLTARVEGTGQALIGAQRMAADAQSARDRATQELAQLLESYETARAALGALKVQWAAAEQQHQAIAAECDQLREREAQQSAAAKELIQAQAERDALSNQLADLRAERDRWLLLISRIAPPEPPLEDAALKE